MCDYRDENIPIFNSAAQVLHNQLASYKWKHLRKPTALSDMFLRTLAYEDHEMLI
jgi:hypothetical protein